MADKKMEFGIIGLGKMGANLSLQAMEKGIRVAGFTLGGIPAELKNAGIVEAKSLEDFRRLLAPPRILFLYIPAGPPVDALLDQMASLLEKNDILVDGGNSYWGDSIRR